MLLTIKQPAHHGYKSFHDYTPPTPPATSRFSPVTSAGPSFPPISATNKSLPPLPATKSFSRRMSTPHRGLPPPGVMTQSGLMTLPPPAHQQQPLQQQQHQQQQHPAPLSQQPPLSQPMGNLPAPPPQWQGAEESMKNWLHAKAEEDKRKQEEEKTRQESLRLEQRKIEQDMLRTSLSGGIPPHMIPMVFAGMGGGNLPNASLEWAQHFMSQVHQQHPQQLLPAQAQTSPEQLQHRDSRVVSQPYGAPQHPVPLTLPSTPIGPSSSQQNAGFLPNYQMSPASRARQSTQGQGIIARPPQTSHLPRLNTGEMLIQPPPAGPSIQHPLQQSQSAQQEQHSSPSIYFHHWQPPTTQVGTVSGANQPTTPSDHTSSPKKRKATGPQQAAPPPTTQPQFTSPPFSGSSVSNTPSSRRRAHSRQRSDFSARGLDSYGRPHSRQGFGRNLTSPPPPASHSQSHVHVSEQQGQRPASSTEPRRRSGGSHPVSSMLEQPPQSQSQQPHQHAQQNQRDSQSQYSAGPEMTRDGRRSTPEERRGASLIKRDEGRD